MRKNMTVRTLKTISKIGKEIPRKIFQWMKLSSVNNSVRFLGQNHFGNALHRNLKQRSENLWNSLERKK
jgi:hypothetical protein